MNRIFFKNWSGEYVVDKAKALKTFRLVFIVSDPGSPKAAPQPIIGQQFIVANDRSEAKNILKENLKSSGFGYYVVTCKEQKIPMRWIFEMIGNLQWRKARDEIAAAAAKGQQIWP